MCNTFLDYIRKYVFGKRNYQHLDIDMVAAGRATNQGVLLLRKCRRRILYTTTYTKVKELNLTQTSATYLETLT